MNMKVFFILMLTFFLMAPAEPVEVREQIVQYIKSQIPQADGFALGLVDNKENWAVTSEGVSEDSIFRLESVSKNITTLGI